MVDAGRAFCPSSEADFQTSIPTGKGACLSPKSKGCKAKFEGMSLAKFVLVHHQTSSRPLCTVMSFHDATLHYACQKNTEA